MDQQENIIFEKLVCLKDSHDEEIIYAIIDEEEKVKLLCPKCLEKNQNLNTHLIPINSAISLIKDKTSKRNEQHEEYINESLNIIKQFCLKIDILKNKIMKLFKEIQHISQQWIKDIENQKQKDDLISVVQLFSQFNINQKEVKKTNQSYFLQLVPVYKQLLNFKDYEDSYQILKTLITEIPIRESHFLSRPSLTVSDIQLVQTVEQNEWAGALAFNKTGKILVAAFDSNLKVWSFENQKISELQTLIGHTDTVYCIVFSKKFDWFISGSGDKSIRFWKEDKSWICTNTVQKHIDYVICLILNKNENNLISSSHDSTIIVWKINGQSLEYDFTLNKHTNSVYGISLNESESALISCSEDMSIILWVRDNKGKWIYQHHITYDDCGHRICFIDDYQILWQQKQRGITHIIKLINNKLIPTPEYNIELNFDTYDIWLFPSIVNKEKQVIIQKHNKYIYILQREKDSKHFRSSQTIELQNQCIYGALTNDGEHLIIWKNKIHLIIPLQQLNLYLILRFINVYLILKI